MFQLDGAKTEKVEDCSRRRVSTLNKKEKKNIPVGRTNRQKNKKTVLGGRAKRQ